jgi:hypothetical protein
MKKTGKYYSYNGEQEDLFKLEKRVKHKSENYEIFDLFRLASRYNEMKQYSEAINMYEQYIDSPDLKRNSTKAYAYRNIAIIMLESGKNKESIYFFNKALELDSNGIEDELRFAISSVQKMIDKQNQNEQKDDEDKKGEKKKEPDKNKDENPVIYNYQDIKSKLKVVIELNKNINKLIKPHNFEEDYTFYYTFDKGFRNRLNQLAVPKQTDFEIKESYGITDGFLELICKPIITLSNLYGIYEGCYMKNLDLFRQNLKDHIVDELISSGNYDSIVNLFTIQNGLESEVNKLEDRINAIKEKHIKGINYAFHKKVTSIPDFKKATNIEKVDFFCRWNDFVDSNSANENLPTLTKYDLISKKGLNVDISEKGTSDYIKESYILKEVLGKKKMAELVKENALEKDESENKLKIIMDYYSNFKKTWDIAVIDLENEPLKELQIKEEKLEELTKELKKSQEAREGKLFLVVKQLLNSDSFIKILNSGTISRQIDIIKKGKKGQCLLKLLEENILPEITTLFGETIQVLDTEKYSKEGRYGLAKDLIISKGLYYELLMEYNLNEVVSQTYDDTMLLRELNSIKNNKNNKKCNFLSDTLIDKLVSSSVFSSKIGPLSRELKASYTWIDSLIGVNNPNNQSLNYTYSRAMAEDKKYKLLNTITFEEFNELQNLNKEDKADNDRIIKIFNSYKIAVKWLKFLKALNGKYAYEDKFLREVEKVKSSLPDDFRNELEYMMSLVEKKIKRNRNRKQKIEPSDVAKQKKKKKKEVVKGGNLLIGSLNRILAHRAILIGNNTYGLLNETEYQMTMTRFGNTTGIDTLDDYNEYNFAAQYVDIGSVSNQIITYGDDQVGPKVKAFDELSDDEKKYDKEGEDGEEMIELKETVNSLIAFVDQASKGDTILITSDIESCLLNGKQELIGENSKTTWNAELLILFKKIKEKAKQKGVKFKISICSTARILQCIVDSESMTNKGLIFEYLFELNDNEPILQIVAGSAPELLTFNKDKANNILQDQINISEILLELKSKRISKDDIDLLKVVSEVNVGDSLDKKNAIIIEAYYRKYILKKSGALKIIFFDNDVKYINKLNQLLIDSSLNSKRTIKEMLEKNDITIQSVHIQATRSLLDPLLFQNTFGGVNPRKLLSGFAREVFNETEIKNLYVKLLNDFNINEEYDRNKYLGGLVIKNIEIPIIDDLGNYEREDKHFNDSDISDLGNYGQEDNYFNDSDISDPGNCEREEKLGHSTLLITKGDGNCLIHALAGAYNSESKMIACEGHSAVRNTLVNYVIKNITKLMEFKPNSKETPIAISLLDHFLKIRIEKITSPEADYYKDNVEVYEKYYDAEKTPNEIISATIKDLELTDKIYNTIENSIELQTQLANMLDKDFDYIRSKENKYLVLKYLMLTKSTRDYLVNSQDSSLIKVGQKLTEFDDLIQDLTIKSIFCTLNYYKKADVWLTNDFAGIYAMMTESYVIVHTGVFNHNGEEKSSVFNYDKSNSTSINHIGIRNGEKGNHFEKIDNLEVWLNEKRENNKRISEEFNKDYTLVENAAEKIVNLFLENVYESKTLQEKQDFCEFIEKEGEEVFIGILQSLYADELPYYLWEGIAATLFDELTNRPRAFTMQKFSTENNAEFSAIVHSNVDYRITIPSLQFFNILANKLNSFSRKDLGDDIEKKKSDIFKEFSDIRSSKGFAAQYGYRLVAEKYIKVFIDDAEEEFFDAYCRINPAETDDEKDERWNEYVKVRKDWMNGDYNIENEDGEKIIYTPPNFVEWKDKMINVLLFSVPGFIMESISENSFIENKDEILSNQSTVKNLNIDDLDLEQFALLFSYSITKDEAIKTFMLERIKMKIIDKKEQEKFQFKASLISELINKKKISLLDLPIIFVKRYHERDKKKEDGNKSLKISYKMKKPNEMEAKIVTTNEKDIMIPSRHNINSTQVIFTEEVKNQISESKITLDDWIKIADNGFVGATGSHGIKTLAHGGKQKMYELKSLGDTGGERCYAIRKYNTLFVVGYEDQKGQQQKHIKKYDGYDIDIILSKKLKEANV